MSNDIISKIRNHTIEAGDLTKLNESVKNLKKFQEKFNFRIFSKQIDEINPDEIYKKGKDDCFFHWIEFKTKYLGAIFTYGGKVYPNALIHIDTFKKLLKIIVNPDIDIKNKIDAEWQNIKGFGGDKLIAKKILYCYYPKDILPIFKTDHLETFARKLNIEFEKKSFDLFGKNYLELTVGEKFELLNGQLKNFKNEQLADIDDNTLCHYLYQNTDVATVANTFTQREIQPLNKIALLFSPQYEQEVVYLFSRFHQDLGFPYIKIFQTAFPDVIVIDEKRKEARIELEVLASDFKNHGHNPDGCDYIICWENDLIDIPSNYPEIISLKEYLSDFIL